MQRNLRVFSRVALILVVLNLTVCPTTAGRAEDFSCKTVISIPVEECEALVALYESTNGPGWTTSTNWLTSVPAKWYGVTVTDGHVESIILERNGLSGTIPSTLKTLANLEILYLSSNQLTGPIPSALGQLTSLYALYLSQNHLTGSIPPTLADLPNLKYLKLEENDLSGPIPAALGNLSQLQILSLGHNQLSGSIPPTLAELDMLVELWLGNNQLTGSIPPELGRITDLFGMDLSYNELTGSIPSALGSISNLHNLNLGYNHLSGSIPYEFHNLANLEDLSLSGNDLTGVLPVWLGDLASLEYLRLDGNQFSGSIPDCLGNLTNLIMLLLSGNQLSGIIPANLGNLVNLEYVELDSNQLSGPVPETLMNIPPIRSIGLAYNRLTIPPSYPDPSNPFHVFLAEKSRDWQLYQAIQVTITSWGAELTSRDQKDTLSVPAGALPEGAVLAYIPRTRPGHTTDDSMHIFRIFQILANDSLGNPITSFTQPIDVTIRYSTGYGPGYHCMQEENFTLYYWDSTQSDWLDVAKTCPNGAYTRIPADNVLSVPMCHLSDFILDCPYKSPVFLPLTIR